MKAFPKRTLGGIIKKLDIFFTFIPNDSVEWLIGMTEKPKDGLGKLIQLEGEG